jgi:hypothetical protein
MVPVSFLCRITYKRGFNIGKIVDLEDLGSRIGTVLSKTTIYGISVP